MPSLHGGMAPRGACAVWIRKVCAWWIEGGWTSQTPRNANGTTHFKKALIFAGERSVETWEALAGPIALICFEDR